MKSGEERVQACRKASKLEEIFVRVHKPSASIGERQQQSAIGDIRFMGHRTLSACTSRNEFIVHTFCPASDRIIWFLLLRACLDTQRPLSTRVK